MKKNEKPPSFLGLMQKISEKNHAEVIQAETNINSYLSKTLQKGFKFFDFNSTEKFEGQPFLCTPDEMYLGKQSEQKLLQNPKSDINKKNQPQLKHDKPIQDELTCLQKVRLKSQQAYCNFVKEVASIENKLPAPVFRRLINLEMSQNWQIKHDLSTEEALNFKRQQPKNFQKRRRKLHEMRGKVMRANMVLTAPTIFDTTQGTVQTSSIEKRNTSSSLDDSSQSNFIPNKQDKDKDELIQKETDEALSIINLQLAIFEKQLKKLIQERKQIMQVDETDKDKIRDIDRIIRLRKEEIEIRTLKLQGLQVKRKKSEDTSDSEEKKKKVVVFKEITRPLPFSKVAPQNQQSRNEKEAFKKNLKSGSNSVSVSVSRQTSIPTPSKNQINSIKIQNNRGNTNQSSSVSSCKSFKTLNQANIRFQKLDENKLGENVAEKGLKVLKQGIKNNLVCQLIGRVPSSMNETNYRLGNGMITGLQSFNKEPFLVYDHAKTIFQKEIKQLQQEFQNIIKESSLEDLIHQILQKAKKIKLDGVINLTKQELRKIIFDILKDNQVLLENMYGFQKKDEPRVANDKIQDNEFQFKLKQKQRENYNLIRQSVNSIKKEKIQKSMAIDVTNEVLTERIQREFEIQRIITGKNQQNQRFMRNFNNQTFQQIKDQVHQPLPTISVFDSYKTTDDSDLFQKIKNISINPSTNFNSRIGSQLQQRQPQKQRRKQLVSLVDKNQGSSKSVRKSKITITQCSDTSMDNQLETQEDQQFLQINPLKTFQDQTGKSSSVNFSLEDFDQINPIKRLNYLKEIMDPDLLKLVERTFERESELQMSLKDYLFVDGFKLPIPSGIQGKSLSIIDIIDLSQYFLISNPRDSSNCQETLRKVIRNYQQIFNLGPLDITKFFKEQGQFKLIDYIIDQKQMKVVAIIIPYLFNLQKVIINNSGLKDYESGLVIRALNSQNFIKEIDLGSSQLGPFFVEQFQKSKQLPRSLKIFKISNINHLNFSITKIINCLENFKRLTELDLSCNDIQYESAKALSLYLQDSNNLKILNLSKCIQNLQAARLVLIGLINNISIENLNLSLNKFQFNQIQTKKAYEVSPNFKSPDPRDLLLKFDPTCFDNRIQENDTLLKLQELIQKPEKNQSISHLDLSFCQLDDHGLEFISQAMKESAIKIIHLNQGEIIKLKNHNLLELFSYKKFKKKKRKVIKRTNQSGNLSNNSNNSDCQEVSESVFIEKQKIKSIGVPYFEIENNEGNLLSYFTYSSQNTPQGIYPVSRSLNPVKKDFGTAIMHVNNKTQSLLQSQDDNQDEVVVELSSDGRIPTTPASINMSPLNLYGTKLQNQIRFEVQQTQQSPITSENTSELDATVQYVSEKVKGQNMLNRYFQKIQTGNNQQIKRQIQTGNSLRSIFKNRIVS